MGLCKGYTLAEILVTLLIVGVISALTIPALITKCHKVIAENRLKSTFSLMANAVKIAEGNGCFTDNVQNFNPEQSKKVFDTCLRPYLKVTHNYTNAQCAEITKSYNSSGKDSTMYVDGNSACYSLINGVTVVFAAGRLNTNSPIYMTGQFRLNPQKKKQIDGKDVFGYGVIDSEHGLVFTSGVDADIFGRVLSEQELIQNCISDSGRISINGYSTFRSRFCTELIRRNNWKIPKNYPLKF